mgnify:CR=1 FL=1|tara:strand:- start:2318 stop:2710 length:393 start_codon:yes stop_codon:yes gene_type:complete
MSYYKMIDNFLGHMDRMRAHDVHDLLKEDERKARHFQVEIGVEYLEGQRSNVESTLTRIRSIDGVTVVSTQQVEGIRKGVLRIKFHPRLESMRPITYVRNVLIPDINSSTKTPGVKVTGIIPGTFKRLDK